MLYDFNHLDHANMSYKEHLFFALKTSFILISGGILGLVHAICPVILVTVHTDTVAYSKQLLDSHTNKDK